MEGNADSVRSGTSIISTATDPGSHVSLILYATSRPFTTDGVWNGI